MEDEIAEIHARFNVLYNQTKGEEFWELKPLLVHYTTLANIEKILSSDEIWFSNPLIMNDMDEVRWGINNGLRIVKERDTVRIALETDERHSAFTNALDHYVTAFDQEHLLDTYVFCLSEHPREDTDGILSMWRGYGANGNGAALVFDTANIEPAHDSPLIFAKVKYGSPETREKWLTQLVDQFAKIIADDAIPDDKLYLPAFTFLDRLMHFALFTKHIGFQEENEWRIVYRSDRDTKKILRHMIGYHVAPRGIEPKLKFKVAPIEGFTSSDLSLSKIVSGILLGPTTSSIMAVRSFSRMLDLIGKQEMKERVQASSIPFRAI